MIDASAHHIEQRITNALGQVVIKLEAGIGAVWHFQARIVSAAFEGKSRVQRHQLVYKALGDRMREEIHALSMQTLTPEEAKNNG